MKPVSKAYVTKEGEEPMKGPFPAVIQEYIPRPMLYKDTGRKFDLRIYVVVTDMQNNLEAAIYKEGLVRCCSVPYEAPSTKNARIPHIHLTNSKINPSSTEEKHEIYKGLLSEWLGGLGENVEETENVAPSSNSAEKRFCRSHRTICENVLGAGPYYSDETLMAIQPTTNLLYDTCFGSMDRENGEPSRSFQTLGFDVMADEQGKVWLLEVNNNPSLNLDTDVDKKIKLPLLSGIFNILSYGFEHGISKSNGDRPVLFSPVNYDRAALQRLNKIRKTYNSACGWYEGGKKPMKNTSISNQTKETLNKSLCKLCSGLDLNTCDSLLESFTSFVAQKSPSKVPGKKGKMSC